MKRLILVCAGIYGVMACSVAQRTREIAIRSALGADRRAVLRLVLSKVFWLSMVGVTAGLVIAAALTRVLAGQLYGVAAIDPLTYGAVATLLVSVALLAGAVPVLRATRIDEARVLRF